MSEAKRMEIAPELVRRAQAGDEEAFSRLYQQTGTTIYRTIFSMVQKEETTWDIHQNTYLLAWRGLYKLEKPEAFLPWLRRIAVNETVKELTREEPLCFSELTSDEGEEPQFAETRSAYQPELELDRKEAARLVREILETLPQKQRLIVGMYYYEGYSIKEIAETLQLTQGTVKTQLHLGRKRIETEVRRLEGEGVKLYGLSPTAFLVLLLRNQEPARAIGKKTAQAVLSEAAAGEPVVLTAKAVGSGFFHTVLGKATAVVLAAAVVAGGVAGYLALRSRLKPTLGDYRPTDPAVITEPAPLVSEPVVSEPVVSEPVTASTEERQEPEPAAPQTPFSWSVCEFDDSILAAVCSEPFSEGSREPTVVWNEGTEDRLLICPRYDGSTVSASRILYDADGRGTVEQTPSYSTVCGEGDCIGASLERPEEHPAWVVTVRTPDGREAGWVLAHNGGSGTPGCEYLIAGEPLEDFSDYPEGPCGIAGHVLKKIGYLIDPKFDGLGFLNLSYVLPLDESSPFFSLGNGLLRSMRRASGGTEAGPAYLISNDYFEGDASAWMARECRMEGDTCCLDAAWLSDHYMNEIYEEDFVPGQGSPRLTLAEYVARQAALFEKERFVGYRGTENFLADEGEELHFDLSGILVYNHTLSAKTVSVTVNGMDAGLFPLAEGDFFTWIPLEYPNQPADKPVRVEARVTETWFGAPDQALLDLWPELSGNLSAAR